VSALLQNSISSLIGAPIIYSHNSFGAVVCIQSDLARNWQSLEVDLLRFSAHHAAVSLSHCLEHKTLKEQVHNMDAMRNMTEQMNRSLQQLAAMKPQDKKKERSQATNLSSRELEVLRLIASGLANKEIANQLFLTESTVELHASRIRKKLKLRSRTALVKYACDHGLV